MKRGLRGAILVGGHGRRMGNLDKARIAPRPTGPTLLERTWRELQAHVDDAFLVGRSDQTYPEVPLTLIVDTIPEAGPLGGLSTALCHARQGWLLLVACDLPSFSGQLVERLWEARTSNTSCVVPTSARGLEPLCALYACELADVAQAALQEGVRAMHEFIARVPHVQHSISDLPPLTNLNTPDDLSDALAYPERA